MKVNLKLTPGDLLAPIRRVFDLAAPKVRDLDRTWDTSAGTPVFTVQGRYTSRGWTEWTQGFCYGCSILVFDATGDKTFYDLGLRRTVKHMLAHVTHIGVHDHGFNNLSTYGNLLRLACEGRGTASTGRLPPTDASHRLFLQAAIRCSGAVQAMRWAATADTDPADGGGYIYSFNGPHSLFIDTMRTVRILSAAHQLGHVLMGENDQRINLLRRAIQHGLTSARYLIFFGDSRHIYDVRGRTAHEAVFNRNDGRFRCRSTQQGYSPFSTWTRGLAWAMLGYAEQLEFLKTREAREINAACSLTKAQVLKRFEQAARATCDHYIDDCTALDGMTYWDDGAPGLERLDDWRQRPADPFNDHEPVDSSASAIAAQGLLRLGQYLGPRQGRRYTQAGLTVAQALCQEPYLATSPRHQGLLLHSVYHRPNNWDHIPRGRRIPCGESTMWGDYHLLELANLIKRMAEGGKYPTFFVS
jgi:unsaturated chondroitin disaccharide hydrolase